MISGSCNKATPIFKRRFIPPENRFTNSFFRSVKPTNCNTSSILVANFFPVNLYNLPKNFKFSIALKSSYKQSPEEQNLLLLAKVLVVLGHSFVYIKHPLLLAQ